MESHRDLIRFEDKFTKQESGCWIWKAGKSGGGYGVFWMNGALRGAHRAALALYRGGDINDSLHVMHSCDNPSCVNPDHLSFGTRSENMSDASKKGRIVLTNDWSGAKNPKSKLSESDRREVERRLSAGDRNRSIADAFGVTIVRIQQIAREMDNRRILTQRCRKPPLKNDLPTMATTPLPETAANL